ncbi:hypothetical protein ACIG0C_30010 [Kitasatospora aureofaciens]|uniref:Microcin J25-processing protein McjB C-terminal domain-containing protein n=1 Tax=Kitasatospora aureofaciens TaxID=1894 RepID=A0A1E7NEA4_KITAU|nr:hypothetical protein [Kitasatospora aureofaciens]ARF83194.1 hypothetical protein B6264_30080 [Kitasatospora aureofaciens]OEV38968.1 hypothetical protein HS99_0017820 [Kitasatospora aureofaciens]GGU99152.1 hypothetical protein GCM10010502_61940 [Kitasatospora aureofaciens]
MTIERHAAEAATRFRRALETSSEETRLIGLREFPHGACLDASLLLAEYLEDCGLGTWECVAGERPFRPALPQSHAWLEQDGLILDITADQFDDAPRQAVWVTRDPSWHQQFGDPEPRARLWRPQDEELLDAYDELRAIADGR